MNNHNDNGVDIKNILTENQRHVLADIFVKTTKSATDHLNEKEVKQIYEFFSNNGDSASSYMINLIGSVMRELPKNTMVHYATHQEGTKTAPAIEQYDEMLTSFEAVKQLDNASSPNTIKYRIKNNRMLGLRDPKNDQFQIPSWQIFNGELIDGIDIVLEILNCNGVEAFRNFTLQLEDYEGKCIADKLREGDINSAIAMARLLSDDANEPI